jgi:hypothetical protein
MSTLLFPLGHIVATPDALALLERHSADARDFLSRHQQGDWGDVDQEDAAMNDHAVDNGDRTFSVYALGNDRIWIITECDRSVTTILLPEDY